MPQPPTRIHNLPRTSLFIYSLNHLRRYTLFPSQRDSSRPLCPADYCSQRKTAFKSLGFPLHSWETAPKSHVSNFKPRIISADFCEELTDNSGAGKSRGPSNQASRPISFPPTFTPTCRLSQRVFALSVYRIPVYLSYNPILLTISRNIVVHTGAFFGAVSALSFGARIIPVGNGVTEREREGERWSRTVWVC